MDGHQAQLRHLLENMPAMPSMACLFQVLISVW